MSYLQEVQSDTPLFYWRFDDNAASTTLTGLVGGVNGTMAANTNTQSVAGALNTSSNTALQSAGTAFGTIALNLSAQTRISVEYWLFWTAFGTDDRVAMEFGTPNYATAGQNGFAIDPNNSGVDNTQQTMGMGGGGVSWIDLYPRPSAGVYHHYVHDMDRSGPTNKVYIDGVIQPTTSAGHTAGIGANFGNTNLYLLSRSGTSLFAATGTRLDELAIYSGGLPVSRVVAHYQAGIAAGIGDSGGNAGYPHHVIVGDGMSRSEVAN